jgi:hypothetical protein
MEFGLMMDDEQFTLALNMNYLNFELKTTELKGKWLLSLLALVFSSKVRLASNLRI